MLPQIPPPPTGPKKDRKGALKWAAIALALTLTVGVVGGAIGPELGAGRIFLTRLRRQPRARTQRRVLSHGDDECSRVDGYVDLRGD